MIDASRFVGGFKAAVGNLKHRPKAVVVSPAFFFALDNEGLLAFKPAAFSHLGGPDAGVDVPLFGGDILVICDPRLARSGAPFRLPV